MGQLPGRGQKAEQAQKQSDIKSSAPSEEFEDGLDSADIIADMRAHLKAEADKSSKSKGLFGAAANALNFFHTDYWINVRRSMSMFFLAWFWYVFNTKTYIPPEYED